jgi:hypothetical protein
MQRLALIGAVVFSAVGATGGLAASQDQCNLEWTKADKDVDGDLSGNEVTRYLLGMMKDPKHRDGAKDGKITIDEFMAACKDGAFDDLIAKAQ